MTSWLGEKLGTHGPTRFIYIEQDILKTMIFFHKFELTDPYIGFSRELQGRMKVIHLAYSDHEVGLLRAAGIRLVGTGPTQIQSL